MTTVQNSRMRAAASSPMRWSAPGLAFLALAAWWTMQALDDVMRDLHLPGAKAVGVTQVMAPLTLPDEASELVRVWHDWDTSRAVTEQQLGSGRVGVLWTVVDVVFAVVLARLLVVLAQQRSARLSGASSSTDRRRAVVALLGLAPALAGLYLTFDVCEDVAFVLGALVLDGGTGAVLDVMLVATWGKWLTLLLAVVPIALSWSVGWGDGRAARRDVGQTLLDLRAQVLAVGVVVAALLLLPGNVRPQVHDLVRSWSSNASAAAAAIAVILLLSALVWVTGHRTLMRAQRRPDVLPRELTRRDLVVAFVAAGAVAAAAVPVHLLLEQSISVLVVAGGLALWALLAVPPVVRRVRPVREAYTPRSVVVRVLAFLPPFALLVVWIRAELPFVVSGDAWRVVVLTLAVAAVAATWWIVDRSPAIPAAIEGSTNHGATGMAATRDRITRVETLVPLAAALGAFVLVGLAAASTGTAERLGSVALIGLLSIGLLGVTAAATASLFGPPRGPLALAGFHRFPVLLTVGVLSTVMTVLVEEPGFHEADLVTATGGERPPLSTVADEFAAFTGVEQPAEAPDARPWTPLVVVATSGGGARAAYWTLLALDCLFGDESLGASAAPACAAGSDGPVPSFEDVFAISGISGGSVGAAMFAAQGPTIDASEVFDPGFVDPVVANLLALDLPNAVAQSPVLRDRAEHLEEVWEDAVEGMDARFFDARPAGAWTPILALNSAAIEDGCRVSVSRVAFAAGTATDPRTPNELSGSCRSFVARRLAPPPAVDPTTGSPSVDTADVPWASTRDLGAVLCADQDLRVSTAALLSARFPYVSPSGAVPFCGDERRFTYLMDGGSVDSSAAGPAALLTEEVVRLARAWNAARPEGSACVQPVVLQLDNGYEDVVAQDAGRRPAELLAPLMGGIAGVSNNADVARQELALLGTQLRERAGCGDEVPDLPTYLQVFPQSHPGIEAPLGWSLSAPARDDLEDQLASAANQCSLLVLRHWLTGSTGGPGCVVGSVEGAAGAAAGGEPSGAGAAVPDRAVCPAGGTYSADGEVRTNAYGVFVFLTEAAPSAGAPLVREGDDSCGALAPSTRADAPRPFGTDALRLGLRYETTPEAPWEPARSNPFVLGLAGLGALAIAVGVLRRRREELMVTPAGATEPAGSA